MAGFKGGSTSTSAPQFGHILRDLPESLFIGKWSKTRNIHEKNNI
jgi:hypothetical protein